MDNKSKNVDSSSIWDTRYQDGELACTQEVVKADPIDYTQHPFLYRQSIAKRVTGDPEGNPLLMVADKYLNLPAKKMLAVGSGLAFKEESLVKNGYVEHLTAFESSAAAVDSARERFRQAGLQDKIEILAGDVMSTDLQPESFDAVFVQAAIHHFYNIEEMFELFHRVLKPGGKIFYDEYIGPDHHMYEPKVFDLMDEINDCLAPSYRWDVMRKETRTEVPQATLDWMLEMDPSEGVHSSRILPLTYKYFDVEFRRDYGGTFMRPFFVGILPNFDFDDAKDQTISRLIILMEEMLLRYGVIPSYHTILVGKKKVRPSQDMTDEEVSRINYSNWKGWGKYGQDSPMPRVPEFSAANDSDDNLKNDIGFFDDAVFFSAVSKRAIRNFTVGRLVSLVKKIAKPKNVDAVSIWDKRYQDGELACTQEVVKDDPIDYTQHPFLWKQSIAKRVTGDPEGNPLQMLADKYFKPPPKKMLTVGSGLAFNEESLVKNGYVEHLIAFESSSAAVDSARERFRRSGLQDRIEIRTGDVMSATLQSDSFDVVYVQAAIHHFYNIEEMFELFHRVLKPDGCIIYDEYIGPDHHIYEPKVFDLMNEINDCLAPSYRWDVLRKETRAEVPRATLDSMLEMDPSEGVHSSKILPLTYKYFDVEFRRDYGGTFMRPFFVGILPNFDFDDAKDQTISRLIILMEEMLIRYGVIPSYHTMVVGKKRANPRQDMADEEVSRINYSNWKGWGKYGQNPPIPKVSEFSAANYSDDNWVNGIGLFGSAIFFLAASRRAILAFVVGRLVTLADNSKRTIVGVKRDGQSLIVTLSGDGLDPKIVGYPNPIKLGDSN